MHIRVEIFLATCFKSHTNKVITGFYSQSSDQLDFYIKVEVAGLITDKR